MLAAVVIAGGGSGQAVAGTLPPPSAGRIVHADVVALDQLLVYNRFGSFNPFGMVFALRRDVSSASGRTEDRPDADTCGALTGTEPGTGDRLSPGDVRLKFCKRPRPLVLRVNAGDILEVSVTNLLRPEQPGITTAYPMRKGEVETPYPPTSRAPQGFCKERAATAAIAPTRADIKAAFDTAAVPPRQCEEEAVALGEEAAEHADAQSTLPPAWRRGSDTQTGADWPRTRHISFVIPGLEPLPSAGGKIDGACTGLDAIRPGETVTCRWKAEREGTHLFSSFAAPAGGQGDGGSLMHGLFGALVIEPAGSRQFRSQVPAKAFDEVWGKQEAPDKNPHARQSEINFAATRSSAALKERETPRPTVEPAGRVKAPRNAAAFSCAGGADIPVLEMTRPCRQHTEGGVIYDVAEIVHGDLNAVVVPPNPTTDVFLAGEKGLSQHRLEDEALMPFREFTTIFHDELKTYYADAFKQLDTFAQLSAARDGFAINYGASGVGSALLANRLGIGPAANCAECLYEEFFLQSWANGDPALLEAFPDDPSNVHHSYLNDKVVFRNLHAGKETHVFHLHAHQWFAGNDAGRGAYLDSQTIGPQQGFTYRIYQGGLDRYVPRDGEYTKPEGWWNSLGSGNRNRTPGDAIFHCHLYPHFAQGMWELWRVHDVLEDGSRVLPDGQPFPGLSVLRRENETRELRPGSVGRAGEWITPRKGRKEDLGTPVPGIIPLPGHALPPLPTYTADNVAQAFYDNLKADPKTVLATDAMPGFPFYIPGRPGHRAPQPPLDMAPAVANSAAGLHEKQIAALGRNHLDGGLPRHVVVEGTALPSVLKGRSPAVVADLVKKRSVLALMLAHGDMTSQFNHDLRLELLPQRGTVLERNAMAFHGLGDESVKVLNALGKEIEAESIAKTLKKAAPQQQHEDIDTRLAALGLTKHSTRLDLQNGAYPVPMLPHEAGHPTSNTRVPLKTTGGLFPVNGSPAAPGAPFADPCGAPMVLAASQQKRRVYDAYRGEWQAQPDTFRFVDDTLLPPAPAHPHRMAADPGQPGTAKPHRMVPDPGLLGFRRFDVSAVQLQLVVNRAGWHDPQARINVLSEQAAQFKSKRRSDAEPFFFRAFSGECITFLHTNETPKKLKLDDFQIAVPTDTIGQHIHLVKFDVTSSDGSGNGFNYEDGTFAPDEIMERICKSKGRRDPRPGEDPASVDEVAARHVECEELEEAGIWAVPRLEGENLKYFQTTVQRWFADPILSYTGPSEESSGNDRLEVADRTMRTVFTHDHFAPSNIQQHGFYAALLIEPPQHAVCRAAEAGAAAPPDCVKGPAAFSQPATPVIAEHDEAPALVGARADVFAAKRKDAATRDADQGKPGPLPVTGAPTADPEKRVIVQTFGDPIHPDAREYAIAIADFALLYDGRAVPGASPSRGNGIDALIDEARHGHAGHPGDTERERAPADLLRARGFAAELTRGESFASLQDRHARIRADYGRPIAPPPRPEAISQKHHDPYLVNYRNEPAPLRIGTDSSGARPQFLANPCRVPGIDTAPRAPYRSIDRQRRGTDGDLSNLFRTAEHGDPCTPILEALSSDRIVVRLIQGAQEVQHTFMVEGRTARRNVDQPFPAERPKGPEAPVSQSRQAACAAGAGAFGRAHEYMRWALGWKYIGTQWSDFGRFIAGCDNVLGYLSAQEIGISEHFEIGSLFSAAGNETVPFLQEAGATAMSSGTTDAPAKPAALVQLTPHGRPTFDHVYHFGSTDAVWNGAWGLVRAYDNPLVADLSACLDAARTDTAKISECRHKHEAQADATQRIGQRLRPFEELRENLRLQALGARQALRAEIISDNAPDDVPPLWCPGKVRNSPDGPGDDLADVEEIVAAVRVADVFPQKGGAWAGTPYDVDLVDRDGLMLVPLTKEDIGLEQSERLAGLISVDPAPIRVDRPQLLEKIRNRHARPDVRQPEPYVLRVQAGDCIDLMVVNALSEKEPDDIGDALMPRITPLNADRDERQYHGDEPFRKAAADLQHPEFRGSRHVALSVPLPSPMRQPLGALPAGGNDMTAIPPHAPTEKPFALTARYYAGFTGLGTPKLDNELAKVFRDYVVADPTLKVDPKAWFRRQGNTGCAEDRHLFLFNEVFCLEGSNEKFEIKKFYNTIIPDLQNRYGKLHAPVPYAFGVLPIRPFGDLVSHGAHGLVGTLVVEPRFASDPRPSRNDVAARIRLPEVDVPEVFSDVPGISEVPAATIREHVLVWQDGLNLRRRLEDGNGQQVHDQGLPGRPVPNCIVCDDSYDLGEQGVSYRSAPFARRLQQLAAGSGRLEPPWDLGMHTYPGSRDDLNRQVFPMRFFDADKVVPPTPTIKAEPGEQMAVRLSAPVGRARQRAFVPAYSGYDDLFPGFGSGHSALLGPGKAFTAWGRAPCTEATYLWRDGPQHTFAGGTWGHLTVKSSNSPEEMICFPPR